MRPPLRELLARAGRRLSSSSGLECSLEGGTKRGAYCTSVDAFVIVKADAARRAYVMEWKYAEKPTVNKVEEWRRRYSERYSAKSSAFSNVVPMDELFYDPQLMRLRFLADRMMTNGELGVSEAKVVVVVPEGNSAYRGRITSPPLANRFPHFKSVSEAMCATLKQRGIRTGFPFPAARSCRARSGCQLRTKVSANPSFKNSKILSVFGVRREMPLSDSSRARCSQRLEMRTAFRSAEFFLGYRKLRILRVGTAIFADSTPRPARRRPWPPAFRPRPGLHRVCGAATLAFCD